MNKKWSFYEEKYILDNASILTDAEIAQNLTSMTGRNITKCSVTHKRQRLGLEKGRGRDHNRLLNDDLIYDVN